MDKIVENLKIAHNIDYSIDDVDEEIAFITKQVLNIRFNDDQNSTNLNENSLTFDNDLLDEATNSDQSRNEDSDVIQFDLDQFDLDHNYLENKHPIKDLNIRLGNYILI